MEPRGEGDRPRSCSPGVRYRLVMLVMTRRARTGRAASLHHEQTADVQFRVFDTVGLGQAVALTGPSRPSRVAPH